MPVGWGLGRGDGNLSTCVMEDLEVMSLVMWCVLLLVQEARRTQLLQRKEDVETEQSSETKVRPHVLDRFR